jgi:hypothetical protein
MAADTSGPVKLYLRTFDMLVMLLVALGLVMSACSSSNPVDGETVKASGPPDVQLDVVAEHSRQFDDEVPTRLAGSQEEFVAAGYISGHLQQAGYRVRLDDVPIGDLVSSTNVVALPPGEGAVEYAVIVPYGTGPGVPPQGTDLGLFLELARAMAVRDPDHHVEFVALGGEFAEGSGGNLGSRRYLKILEENDEHPFAITPAVVAGGGFASLGASGDELNRIAERLGLPEARPLNDPLYPSYLRVTEMYSGAHIQHAIATGGAEEVGRVLLELMSGG